MKKSILLYLAVLAEEKLGNDMERTGEDITLNV